MYKLVFLLLFTVINVSFSDVPAITLDIIGIPEQNPWEWVNMYRADRESTFNFKEGSVRLSCILDNPGIEKKNTFEIVFRSDNEVYRLRQEMSKKHHTISVTHDFHLKKENTYILCSSMFDSIAADAPSLNNLVHLHYEPPVPESPLPPTEEPAPPTEPSDPKTQVPTTTEVPQSPLPPPPTTTEVPQSPLPPTPTTTEVPQSPLPPTPTTTASPQRPTEIATETVYVRTTTTQNPTGGESPQTLNTHDNYITTYMWIMWVLAVTFTLIIILIIGIICYRKREKLSKNRRNEVSMVDRPPMPPPPELIYDTVYAHGAGLLRRPQR